MESDLMRISQKMGDYVLCPNCGNINWYENAECVSCDSPELENVDIDDKLIIEWVKKEYEFWIRAEYTEDEADEVTYDV